MRISLGIVAGVLGSALSVAALAGTKDCTALEHTATSAEDELGKCVQVGKGCEAEFARRDQARARLADCAPAIRSETPAGSGTRVSLLVIEADEHSGKAIEVAAREALADVQLADSGSVRAARAFLGLKGTLDDVAAAKLKEELRAERLYIIEVRPDGSSRYVVIRVADGSSVIKKSYFESDANSVQEDVAKQLRSVALGRAARPTIAVPTSPPSAAPEGEVRLTRNPDVVRNCRYVGQVDAKTALGGWGGAMGATGSRRLEQALQKKAAEVGANVVQIVTTTQGYSSGEAYACP